jgi:hypothetical protein
MLSRTIATVCWRVITPANDRGAFPNTSVVRGGGGAWAERYQEMKLL